MNPARLVQTRLGHSSATTMDRYGHLHPSAEAALADALEATYNASNVVALDRAQDAAWREDEPTIGKTRAG